MKRLMIIALFLAAPAYADDAPGTAIVVESGHNDPQPDAPPPTHPADTQQVKDLKGAIQTLQRQLAVLQAQRNQGMDALVYWQSEAQGCPK